MINIPKKDRGETGNADPLMQKFVEKADSFVKAHPEEGKHLMGEMTLYASSDAGPGKVFWDAIKDQILYRVQQHKTHGQDITPEKFIDYLFEPNESGEIDHDIIMARLQIG